MSQESVPVWKNPTPAGVSRPMRRSLVGFVLFAVSCGAPPPAKPPAARAVVVEPPKEVENKEPPAPTGPLVLDVAGDKARWLDPPTADKERKRWVYETVMASGQRAAVAKTSVGEYYGWDERSGVVGPLALPAASDKFLFGPGDSLLVVTQKGELWSAPSVASAKSVASFERRDAPANATDWDSANDYLVATDGKQVHTSRDGGKSWSVVKGAAWGNVTNVLVRFDGVMAVVGGPAKSPTTFLSRDDGKTWQRSSFQPSRLSRSGSFIWSDVWNCTAVLSENGSTWSKGGEALTKFRTARSVGTVFSTQTTPEGFTEGAFRSTSDPPPPKVPGAKETRVGRGCPPPPGLGKKGRNYGILGLLGSADVGVLGSLEGGAVGLGWGSGEGLGGIGLVGSRGTAREPTPICDGAPCLAPPKPAAELTRTRFSFFNDGICARAESAGKCAPGSFDRPPHVAVVDETTGKRKVADLPNGCTPDRLVSASGLGILTCRGSGSPTLWVADATGAFRAEGSLTDRMATSWPVAVGRDGTLVFHEGCKADKPCRALVRRPLDPGAPSTFRMVQVRDAIGYRALVGGKVLAIVRVDQNRLDFVLSEAGKPDVTLAKNVPLEGDLADVSVDDQGRVLMRERKDSRAAETSVVGVDGKRYPL